MAMTVADFSGAEAEELRRAVGMRRSWQRMEQLEVKLRSGMTKNGLDAATQDNIIQNITSVRALWISRIPCRQLRLDCLRFCLFQGALPGCVYLRDSQQSADGFLRACCAG